LGERKEGREGGREGDVFRGSTAFGFKAVREKRGKEEDSRTATETGGKRERGTRRREGVRQVTTKIVFSQSNSRS
jgi:hypothetical protein